MIIVWKDIWMCMLYLRWGYFNLPCCLIGHSCCTQASRLSFWVYSKSMQPFRPCGLWWKNNMQARGWPCLGFSMSRPALYFCHLRDKLGPGNVHTGDNDWRCVGEVCGHVNWPAVHDCHIGDPACHTHQDRPDHEDAKELMHRDCSRQDVASGVLLTRKNGLCSFASWFHVIQCILHHE